MSATAPMISRARAGSFVVGVLLLQAAFIASYIGGLHEPNAHGISVGVVAPPAATDRIESALGHEAASAVDLQSRSEVGAAKYAIGHREVYGVYVPAGQGQQATLYIASARGPATAQTLKRIFSGVADQQHVRLRVRETAPLSPGDPQGLVPYYLVIGWLVGAYLAAAILGIYRGMTPRGVRRGAIRLGALALYAAASGAIGVLIAETGYGYVSGHPWVVLGIGALLVFAVATFTTALESLAGIAGTGVAILLFVVLGNPSAGGPWSFPMEPWPWSVFGPYLPNGAATTAVLQAVYFDAQAVLVPLLIMAGYAVAGVLGTLALSRRGRPLLELERVADSRHES